MKKIFLFIAVALFFCVGCAIKEEPGLKGEWIVVSTNGPDILAEKNKMRRVFRFRPSADHYSTSDFDKLSQEVKPGWVIEVENNHRYCFFPPGQK